MDLAELCLLTKGYGHIQAAVDDRRAEELVRIIGRSYHADTIRQAMAIDPDLLA